MAMAAELSVTRLVGMLKDGDGAAAQRLWEAYFGRLVALARAKLRGIPTRAADEEDVALSAFDSLCRRAEAGRFPLLADRDDLWQLLFVITVRKALSLVRHEGRASRGRGRVLSLSDLPAPEVDRLVGGGPTPDLAAQMTEECRRLLDVLDDDTLRSVALWKMEGYTDQEIADRLGCIRQTVGRKLKLIRELWSDGGLP
jgi:DNA-directed RNA polymerase specialized sigma24 family protein